MFGNSVKKSRRYFASTTVWVTAALSAIYYFGILQNPALSRPAVPNASQSYTPDKWVQLLRLSIAAQPKPITIANEDDGAFRTVDLTKKRYTGDAITLAVIGATERHVYNIEVNKAVIVNRSFTYDVKYSDLASTELKDTSVVLKCSRTHNCIEHVVKGQDCDPKILAKTGCRGSPISEKRLLSSMTLNFADAVAAKDAKDVFDILIKINLGAALPSGERKLQSDIPVSGMPVSQVASSRLASAEEAPEATTEQPPPSERGSGFPPFQSQSLLHLVWLLILAYMLLYVLMAKLALLVTFLERKRIAAIGTAEQFIRQLLALAGLEDAEVRSPRR